MSAREGDLSVGPRTSEIVDPFYAVVRVIARFWIWFFFERVEVRHLERVPRMGPVLPRKVHYLMSRHTIPMGPVLGIPLEPDYSWFLVFAVLTWALARLISS
jgi:hypothetical protein